MAVAKNSKSQKSANKPNGKPNGKPKSAQPEPKGLTSLAKNPSTKDAPPKPAVRKDNEAQIAVHWKEEECFYPSPKFIGQANLNDPAVVERFSEKNFPECFRDYAELLDWDQYWHTTLDTSNPPFWKWFVGGKLNACYNCVDRHLAQHKNKAALIFVPEPESETATVITFQELYRRVNEVAAMLRDFAGLKTGDRVTIHMPMIPELPITMLACARLGVVHSVVFGGFSGEACGLRAADSGSRVLIYADGYHRNGKWVDHKASADIAVETAKKEGQTVDKVLIWKRYPGHFRSESPMIMGRDFFVDEVLKNYRNHIVDEEIALHDHRGFGRIFMRIAAPDEYFIDGLALFFRGFHGDIGASFVVHPFAVAMVAVGVDQDAAAGVGSTEATGLTAEAAEDDRVDDP